MPKSKNKRKSGSGKKGTAWNKKVVQRIESDRQKKINDEREFMLGMGLNKG